MSTAPKSAAPLSRSQDEIVRRAHSVADDDILGFRREVLVARADCSGDPGGVDFPPFKYGYCHDGTAGACCAPAKGFCLIMTWPQWRYVRDHTSLSWQDWLDRVRS